VAAGGGSLDVIDVLPIQLENLGRKLPAGAPVRRLRRNSTRLGVPDAHYDRALVFLLLHEQPARERERTPSEVLRVVKPGGTIVIVDYARPRWWHPLRYVWAPCWRCSSRSPSTCGGARSRTGCPGPQAPCAKSPTSAGSTRSS
jgi:SAM-dependent methyltransferase